MATRSVGCYKSFGALCTPNVLNALNDFNDPNDFKVLKVLKVPNDLKVLFRVGNFYRNNTGLSTTAV